MTVKAVLCYVCKHNWGLAQPDRCRAFPKGIPRKYLYGQTVHRKVTKDQEGDFTFKFWQKGA